MRQVTTVNRKKDTYHIPQPELVKGEWVKELLPSDPNVKIEFQYIGEHLILKTMTAKSITEQKSEKEETK